MTRPITSNCIPNYTTPKYAYSIQEGFWGNITNKLSFLEDEEKVPCESEERGYEMMEDVIKDRMQDMDRGIYRMVIFQVQNNGPHELNDYEIYSTRKFRILNTMELI